MICGSGRALKLGLRATSGSFMNTPSYTLSTVYNVTEVVTHRVWDDSIFKSGLATMLARANKLHFRGFRVYSHIKLQDSSSVTHTEYYSVKSLNDKSYHLTI